MRLELMRGGQLRKAIAENLPLVIPAGVLEYRGEHRGLGCDTLVVTRALELLEVQLPLVIAPAFHYGPASYAVAEPEMGTIDVDNDRLEAHIKNVLLSLLRVGFKSA